MRYLICALLVLITGNAYSDNNIKEIKNIYYSTNNFIKKMKIEPECYMILHQAENTNPIDCSNMPEDYVGLVSEFNVYVHDKKLLKVNELTSSSAGDQNNSLVYYFYPSLKTAFVLEEHTTFNCIIDEEKMEAGLCKVERRLYYDKNGAKIRDNMKVLLIESEKEREFTPSSIQYADPQIMPDAVSLAIYGHLINVKRIK